MTAPIAPISVSGAAYSAGSLYEVEEAPNPSFVQGNDAKEEEELLTMLLGEAFDDRGYNAHLRCALKKVALRLGLSMEQFHNLERELAQYLQAGATDTTPSTGSSDPYRALKIAGAGIAGMQHIMAEYMEF